MKEMFNTFRFELFEEKRIKIYYNGTEDLTVLIGFQLTGTNIQSYFYKHKFLPFSWAIPNYDLLGIDKLYFYNAETREYLFEWLVPKINVKPLNRQKIVCIGLNKTGTTSFHKGLEDLGMNFFPVMQSMVHVTPSYYHDNLGVTLSILENPKFDAYEDLPFSLPSFYKKIYPLRPNDIYVLTIRENREKWVQSFKRYFKWLTEKKLDIQNNIHPITFTLESAHQSFKLKNFITPLFSEIGLFESEDLDKTLHEFYEKYNEEVIEYFKNKPQSNFIVLDVSKKNELKRFTNWLGIPNQTNDFPWENKTV